MVKSKSSTATKKKSASVSATRPISDFFTRKSVTASSASSQSENAPIKRNKSASISSSTLVGTKKPLMTVSDASSPATPRPARAFMDSVHIVSPSDQTQYLMPPAVPFLKPSSSPSVRSRSPRSPAAPRKPKFDSDSDADQTAPAVYISRSPVRSRSPGTTTSSAHPPLRSTENLSHSSQIRSNPNKKPRLSSPEPSELVPTSQSDEFDMSPALSPPDPLLVNRNVDQWRHNAVTAPALLVEDDLFNDSSLSAFSMECTSPERPSSPLSPPPPSPKALNPDTKAAQIIAEIKAKAMAASLLHRAESPVLEFKDELSDDDLPESPMRPQAKATISKARVTSLNQPPTCYSLRNRDPSPSPSGSKHASNSTSLVSSKRPRVASSRMPVTLTAPNTQKGKAKAFNPLDELLKEKKRDNERGKGSEALRQAEAALANKDMIMRDIDEDDFTNEAAARKAVAVVEHKRRILKSSSPMSYDAHGAIDSEDELNDEDRVKLLGDEAGKSIADLLNSDKASRRRETEIEKLLGVPFWQDEDLDNLMEVDEAARPSLDLLNSPPLLALLQGTVNRGDLAHASILISSGALSSISLPEYPALFPYLCELALSSDDVLAKTTLQFLVLVWNTTSRVPGIPFSCIISALTRLGAEPTILAAMGWTLPEAKASPNVMQKRDAVLYHLVALVSASAASRRLSKDEIPDTLMALILVANDPTSSPELQSDIMIAIDRVCQSIGPAGDISAALESMVCNKLLKYLSTVEPINKAYIVGLFGSGTGRTKRIARWTAHCVISNKHNISSKRYSELPSLFPLIGELTRACGETNPDPGKFEQHAKADYVDMMYYTRILSVALTNVSGYVREEMKAPRPISRGTGASRDPPEPPLRLVRLAIENIHSRISDIRATHLDRSRTKAALKELSLRIHYQREVATKAASTLDNYFGKPKPRLKAAPRVS
ncbi:hypothetical protein H0H81_002939 [Sphagnurus paluster]|uniref:Uncharacterized protein n=1 Tax=Sphagnurus paluster TaxID=117069 RepID=A0A9P7FVI0_9AGAR|nr:hypothetical protein H0H81_002939 [Sphagnurus paluster]